MVSLRVTARGGDLAAHARCSKDPGHGHQESFAIGCSDLMFIPGVIHHPLPCSLVCMDHTAAGDSWQAPLAVTLDSQRSKPSGTDIIKESVGVGVGRAW